MYDKDDLLPHITAFAAILSSLPDRQRGMLIDVPRSVDYTSRRNRAKRHQRDLEETADDMLSSLALEGEDSPVDREELWRTQLQADIAKERAAVANFYQHTTSKREHYVVLKVSQLDAARAISGKDGGLADLDIIGRPVKERRVDKLRDQQDLTPLMVQTLTKRLEGLAKHLDKLHGISAKPISSLEYTEVIADSYRTDDVSQIQDFQTLVRRSPVPDRSGDVDFDHNMDPVREVDHHENNPEAPAGITDYASEDEVKQQYRTLVSPEEYWEETDGAVTIDWDHRSATIAITGWPEVPPLAFLEELYRYSHPGVNVTIATHFYKKPMGKAKRDAKKQENSIADKLEGTVGDIFEDYLKEKYQEAAGFARTIEGSKYSVFDVGLFVEIEASNQFQDEQTGEFYESDERLETAIEDITLLLEEESGFDTQEMFDRHDEGWQTTKPIADNELGENVTLRADGLARQWAYQYRNREDPEGIKFGLHDYLRQPTAIDIYGLENGHNGGLYGTIGSGKTTSLQEIANALMMYHDAEDIPFKMILSTPLQDLASLCDTYGGKHIRVGSDSAVNPLAVHYVPPDKYRGVEGGSPWQGWITRFDAFLASYYEIMNLSDLGTKRDTWMIAAKEAQKRHGIYPNDPESFTNKSAVIPDVVEVLEDMVLDPSPFVRDRLEEDEATLTGRQKAARTILNHDVEAFDGVYSHFCERSDLDLMDHDVIYLDFRDQESNERAGGLEMMMRLSDLHEQQKNFSGRTWMGIDEFHYMLTNPRSADFFKRLHRHSRHWTLAVWLATQEFGDLFEEVTDENGNTTISLSKSAKVIFNNQAMQIYHYTKEMNPTWAEKLGLSERSEQFISNADSGKKGNGYAQALLVVDEEQYPLRVEMSDEINPRQFAIYQHDPTDDPSLRAYLRDYADDRGRDVCNWRWEHGQGV